MFVRAFAARWSVVALMVLAISVSCVETMPGERSQRQGARETSSVASTGRTGTMAELRAAYIATVQSDAGETYRPAREASGAVRFVHLSQGFEVTIDGAEVRLAPEKADTWELSLSTTEIGCDEGSELNLKPSVVEMSGNRVEIARGSVSEWYVNGPLGLEQGFTLNQAPPCKGTKVVTIEVSGSVVPKLVDEDRDGMGEAVSFVDVDGVQVATYTDLYVSDAMGKRLDAWMSVTAGRLSLHVDDVGAAYPMQIDPLIEVEQAKLTAGDGAANDYFGGSVALSGDTALVGAPRDTVGANVDQGSAYVFTRNGAVWTQQQKLTASDGAAGEWFGYSVALSADTALVGARDGFVGANDDQGSAYVFTRSGGVWSQQQKLTASDGSAFDWFGYSVALSGDMALVGAPSDAVGANVDQGSAYVFTRSNAVWTQQQQLTASDGAVSKSFGGSVALSGDTALVGATGTNGNQGSAYVFTQSGAVWTQQQEITASDGAAGDYFSVSVALSGDTALVGAFLDDVGATNEQGSAYVFTRSGAVWTQQQQLTTSDGVASDWFGVSVALSGDVALVGAWTDAVGANGDPGSAYVFTRSGGVWTQQLQLTGSDQLAGDFFGNKVALSGDTALVGAYLDDVGANSDQGSAYVFVLSKSNGDACASNVECGSGLCVDDVCCNAACGEGSSGDCQACSVTAGAAVDGICAPLSMGTECRASAGTCDSAESCDGTSDACPADAKVAAGTECRASAGECDVGEKCDGTTDNCPADVNVPDGSLCADGACINGVCMGSNGSGGSGGSDGSGGSGGRGGEDGGCACRVAEKKSGDASHAALSLLGVTLFVTRRRNRSRRG